MHGTIDVVLQPISRAEKVADRIWEKSLDG
jgi:hypothetical protein